MRTTDATSGKATPTLNGSRYEFAINATTGDMVEWERD